MRLGWLAMAVALASLVAACGDDAPLLERSCRGKAVPNCLPYEYSVVEDAVLEPSRVEVDHPDMDVHVRVELANCGEDTPRGHIVAITARAETESDLADGGTGTRVFEVLTVRDDGTTFGDDVAKDGVIDVTVENPFIGPEVLADKQLLLRFEPRTPPECSEGVCISCRGEAFEVEYHTGPRFMP